jgi:hypothetical protein
VLLGFLLPIHPYLQGAVKLVFVLSQHLLSVLDLAEFSFDSFPGRSQVERYLLVLKQVRLKILGQSRGPQWPWTPNPTPNDGPEDGQNPAPHICGSDHGPGDHQEISPKAL